MASARAGGIDRHIAHIAYRRVEAGNVVGHLGVRGSGRWCDGHHRIDRRAGGCRRSARQGVDQALSRRNIRGARCNGAAAACGGTTRSRAARGHGARPVASRQTRHGLCDVRVCHILHAVVFNGHRIDRTACRGIGGNATVVNGHAQVGGDRRNRNDVGLDHGSDERTHGVGTDVVIAVVDHVVGAGGCSACRNGVCHIEAAALAVGERANVTFDERRPWCHSWRRGSAHRRNGRRLERGEQAIFCLGGGHADLGAQ